MSVRRAAVAAAIAVLAASCAPAGPAAPAAPAARAAPTTPVSTPTPVRLSLSGLFHPTGTVGADPAHTWTLIATGDAIPARLVNIDATRRGDFLWPFRPTADHVKNADVTFVNLETPLLAGCPARSGGLVFCGDPRFVDGLTLIGADVANLANNHVYAGPDTKRTADLLQQHGPASRPTTRSSSVTWRSTPAPTS